MRIKKNGKVINLTESDVKRIVKKVLTESSKETGWLNTYKGNIVITNTNNLATEKSIVATLGNKLPLKTKNDVLEGSFKGYYIQLVGAGDILQSSDVTLSPEGNDIKATSVNGNLGSTLLPQAAHSTMITYDSPTQEPK
jgi:hypothetical protein